MWPTQILTFIVVLCFTNRELFKNGDLLFWLTGQQPLFSEATTTPRPTITFPADFLCADKASDCADYGEDYCTGTYQDWMTDNCPRFCKLCKGTYPSIISLNTSLINFINNYYFVNYFCLIITLFWLSKKFCQI